MKAEFEIHPIQVNILRFLLFHPRAGFAQLNTGKITNDHFTFHLHSLIEAGLVAKDPSGKYTLTAKGKELANRFDTDRLVFEKQAKVTVLVCARKIQGKKIYYLMQQRLKQPYYGFYGLVTGKISIGETVYETAARELEEETGLTAAKLKLVGIEHKMDYGESEELLEDKFFFVFRAEGLSGNLKSQFEGGKNIWSGREEVSRLPNLFEDVKKLLTLIEENRFSFLEDKYKYKVGRF